MKINSTPFTYQHDPNGNRTNALIEIGTHTLQSAYQFEAANRELHSIAIRPRATNTTHYTYSPLNGRLQTVSNTLSGITTHYQHDLMDQLTNITYRTANGNRYTFQGRVIDWDTGLYNFRARWYAPCLIDAATKSMK